jgi:hypothetical protein
MIHVYYDHFGKTIPAELIYNFIGTQCPTEIIILDDENNTVDNL